MFTTYLGELREYVGKGFVLAVWLPVLTFASALFVVYQVGRGSLNAAWSSWLILPLDGQVVQIIEFLAVVTLVAYVVHQLEVPITRFFEGYWESWPFLSNLGHWKAERYKRYLAALDKQIEHLEEVPAGQKPSKEQMVKLNLLYDRRGFYFPPKGNEAHVMPTRLGNIYKVAELYPYHHYGIDSVVIWPRLLSVLPGDFVKRLQDTKIAVDFLLLFGLLSVLFSLVTVPYLLAFHADWSIVVLCALGLPLGIIAYYSALAPAMNYAELIKAAFDLYRRALLEALGLQMLSTLTEERQLWKNLCAFFAHGLTPDEDFHFDMPKPKA